MKDKKAKNPVDGFSVVTLSKSGSATPMVKPWSLRAPAVISEADADLPFTKHQLASVEHVRLALCALGRQTSLQLKGTRGCILSGSNLTDLAARSITTLFDPEHAVGVNTDGLSLVPGCSG